MIRDIIYIVRGGNYLVLAKGTPIQLNSMRWRPLAVVWNASRSLRGNSTSVAQAVVKCSTTMLNLSFSL